MKTQPLSYTFQSKLYLHRFIFKRIVYSFHLKWIGHGMFSILNSQRSDFNQNNHIDFITNSLSDSEQVYQP